MPDSSPQNKIFLTSGQQGIRVFTVSDQVKIFDAIMFVMVMWYRCPIKRQAERECDTWKFRALFYKHGSILIQARISNYINYVVWDEIIFD